MKTKDTSLRFIVLLAATAVYLMLLGFFGRIAWEIVLFGWTLLP